MDLDSNVPDHVPDVGSEKIDSTTPESTQLPNIDSANDVARSVHASLPGRTIGDHVDKSDETSPLEDVGRILDPAPHNLPQDDVDGFVILDWSTLPSIFSD